MLHMVMGDYAIFNMAQPDREQAVERVHQVPRLSTATLMLAHSELHAVVPSAPDGTALSAAPHHHPPLPAGNTHLTVAR